MKKILLFICITTLANSIRAQQNYGTVGSQKIDGSFNAIVQQLYPDFALSPKADIFTGRLQKFYIFPKASADEARKRGLDKDPQIKAQLELMKQLAEDKFLDYLMKTEKQEVVPVSDADVRSFYNAHLVDFTPPTQYSYLVSYLYDTSAAMVKSVKQKLEMYAKDEAQLDEFKMGSKETFTLSFEKKRNVLATQTEYNSLKGLPVKKVSEPIHESGMLVMYCITSKTEGSPKLFEEVKDLCKTQLQSDKTNAASEEVKKAALGKYPITLDKVYFQQ